METELNEPFSHDTSVYPLSDQTISNNRSEFLISLDWIYSLKNKRPFSH